MNSFSLGVFDIGKNSTEVRRLNDDDKIALFPNHSRDIIYFGFGSFAFSLGTDWVQRKLRGSDHPSSDKRDHVDITVDFIIDQYREIYYSYYVHGPEDPPT